MLNWQYTLPSVLWHCWLGHRKGIWPVKNWVVGCWHGYLSGARCRLACGPADSTATHCLASAKSRLVLPFWYRLTWVVPEKGLQNVCVARHIFDIQLLKRTAQISLQMLVAKKFTNSVVSAPVSIWKLLLYTSASIFLNKTHLEGNLVDRWLLFFLSNSTVIDIYNSTKNYPSAMKFYLQCFDAVGWAAGRASGL